MIFSAKSFFFIGIISFALFSCKDQEPREGGPCSYRIDTSPAVVIGIEKHDSLSSEILFSVEKEGKQDTVTYSHYFGGWASKDVIEKYDLRLGKIFTFEEHEEIKGTCEPYYYSLKLVNYKAPHHRPGCD